MATRNKKPARRKPLSRKPRWLRFESLEPRQLLSASDILAAALVRMTPDPHPAGDQPPEDTQAVLLTNFSPIPLPPDTGDPVISQFVTGAQAVLDGIQDNPDARPGYWGENVPTAAHEYRLHLDDNGMLVRYWTVDWGDDTAPQRVTPQPWAIHQYPAAGEYTIQVSANTPDGNYAANSSGGILLNQAGQTTDSAGIGGGGTQASIRATAPMLHVADSQTVAQRQAFWLDNLAAFTYPDVSTLTVTDGVSTDFTYSIDWGDCSPPLDGTTVDVLSAGSTEDGTPFMGALRSDTADGPLAHVYGEPGTYYLAVTVAQGNLSDTQTIPVNVVDLTPTITGLPAGNTCIEGTTVTLTASFGNEPVACDWQILDPWGDTVAESVDPAFSYTFTGPGTYTVSLLTMVGSLTSPPTTVAVTVSNVAPEFTNSLITPVTAAVWQMLTFPSIGFTDAGLSDYHNATIDWGDGTVDDAEVAEPCMDGSTPVPGRITGSHAYSSAGTGSYTITIALTDDGDLSATPITFTVNIVALDAVPDVALRSFSVATIDDVTKFQVPYRVVHATAVPFTIGVYTSPDGTAADQLLTSVLVNGDPGLELTAGDHTASIPLPTAMPPGDYYLLAQAEADATPDDNSIAFGGGIFSLSDGRQNTIYVFGTDAADTVAIHGPSGGDAGSIVINGDTPYGFDSSVAQVEVRAEGGDDSVQADADVAVPLVLYGGEGNDTLVGSWGDDVVDGGSGQNVIKEHDGWNSPQTVDDSELGDPAVFNCYFQADSTPPTVTTASAGFNGSERVLAAGSGTSATWMFDTLNPTAYYDVYVTWSPEADAGSAAYVVKDDETPINPLGQASIDAVDQTQAPADDFAAGVFWRHLGVFQVESSTLNVHLAAGASAPVLADAVRLVCHATAPVTNLSMSTNGFTLDQDGILSVTYTVTGADSPPFSIGVYGSPDARQPAELLQSFEVDDPALLAGGGQSYTVTFPAAFGDLGANGYVVAKVDADNVVAETSESDNVSQEPPNGVFQSEDGVVHFITPTGTGTDNVTVTQDGDSIMIVGTQTYVFSNVAEIDIVLCGGNGSLDATGVTVPLRIHGGSGNCTITGGSGNDVIYGGAGSNTIHGGPGNDEIHGGGGGDLLYGDDGNDWIDGGAGDDEIHGGDGNDWAFGGAGADQVYGELGNDVIHGGDGDDTLAGGYGDDDLYGDNGADRVYGGEIPPDASEYDGHDNISGGPGLDPVLDGHASFSIPNDYKGNYLLDSLKICDYGGPYSSADAVHSDFVASDGTIPQGLGYLSFDARSDARLGPSADFTECLVYVRWLPNADIPSEFNQSHWTHHAYYIIGDDQGTLGTYCVDQSVDCPTNESPEPDDIAWFVLKDPVTKQPIVFKAHGHLNVMPSTINESGGGTDYLPMCLDAIMIRPLWPEESIRPEIPVPKAIADARQTNDYVDWQDTYKPVDIPVESPEVQRLAVHLHAEIDKNYQSTDDWRAVLPSVPGLEFWNSATDGTMYTSVDAAGDLIYEKLEVKEGAGLATFDRIVYVSQDPSATGGTPDLATIAFHVEIPSGTQGVPCVADVEDLLPCTATFPEQDSYELAHGIDPDSRLTSKQQAILNSAQIQMTGDSLSKSGLSQAEQDLRIEVLEAVMTGKVKLPAGGTVGVRNPAYWSNPAGAEHDHYVVAAGQDPERAIDDLWDGGFTPKIWCAKYSAIIMLEALFRYYQEQGSQTGTDFLNNMIGNKIIAQDLVNYGVGVFWTERYSSAGYTAAALEPGDQIWFQNPYYHQGKQLIFEQAYKKYLGEGKGDAEARSLASAFADKETTGEEGSNVFYLGLGAPRMKDSFGNDASDQPLIMSIYTHAVFTFDAYKNYFINGDGSLSVTRGTGYDASVQAVKADFIAHPEKYDYKNPVSPDKFLLKRIRSVTNPNTYLR